MSRNFAAYERHFLIWIGIIGMSLVTRKIAPLEINMPATFAEVDQACVRLEDFLLEHNQSRLLFEVILLAREALVNAVRHGCGMDSRKMVSFKTTLTRTKLTLQIEDPGAGFDWERLCRKQPDPLSEHGRGMTIFQIYSHSVTFNTEGNKITIHKKL